MSEVPSARCMGALWGRGAAFHRPEPAPISGMFLFLAPRGIAHHPHSWARPGAEAEGPLATVLGRVGVPT